MSAQARGRGRLSPLPRKFYAAMALTWAALGVASEEHLFAFGAGALMAFNFFQWAEAR